MLTIKLGAAWQRAQRRDTRARVLGWSQLRPAECSGVAAWGQAVHLAVASSVPWGDVPARDMARCALWQLADPQDAASRSAWAWVPTRDQCSHLGWDGSVRVVDMRLLLIYKPNPAKQDVTTRAAVRRVDAFGARRDAASALRASLYLPSTPLGFSFGGQAYFPPSSPEVFFDFRYVAPVERIQPVDSFSGRVRWQDARRLNLQSRIPWGRARVLDGAITGIEYPDYPGPVKPLPEPPPDPEILDTYMIANTVNLVVLPSRTPIEAKNVQVGWDADSFSWKFSADIFTQAALDLVRPDASGAKEVELDINGWTWVLLVERYSRNRKFPAEAYSISGATRSQLLAAPYAPLRTALNAAPITAAQQATEELLHTGFTLDWQASDWTFPVGTLSYQGQTAMQVIARLAETIGAIVRPSRNSDALEVLPRYPAPPWEWNDASAPIARIIPPAMMTDLSGEWTPQPAWNACYVSGTSHGVSMLVRRAGTSGDNPTADVYDDWLTGQEANQARGTHELSKGGDIEIVGVTIPLFHLTDDHGVGLVLPGQLCRVPEETGAWVGLCLAVDISAEGTGAVRVKQHLKLERHH